MQAAISRYLDFPFVTTDLMFHFPNRPASRQHASFN
jgi:hypothetical protein